MPVTESQDAHYKNNIADWRLISKFWTGKHVQSELVRGPYEARRAFESRKKGAQFQPYTRDLLNRLSGELFSRANEVTRSTEVSGDFLDSVGPDDQSYHVQLINLTEVLLAYNEAVILMDPAQGLRVVEPQHVPRTSPRAVVVKGTRTSDGTVFTDEQEQDAWTIYYDNRYETYVKSDKEGVEEEKVDQGLYNDEEFAFQNGPPALRITLPWRVQFGLSVGKAHRSLYRLESKVDAALTNALGGGLLQIATGGDDEAKTAIEKALKNGAIAVPYDSEHGEHKSLNVGTDGLDPGQEKLKQSRKEMYRTAYQSLDQASSRMTATEADARNRSGPAAALSVLAETIQSAEMDILPLIAQAEDFRRANATLTPDVSWPTDFSDAFEGEERELTRDIFGELGLPVPLDAAAEVVADRLETNGFEADREAIRQEIRQRRDRAEQSPTDE